MNTGSPLSIQPIRTRIFRHGESLVDFVAEHVGAELIRERMIFAVTSKIVSLSEERLVEKSTISKQSLVNQEADHNLGEVGYGCFLTIKEGLFIPSAGIDESNSEKDQYILYPREPFASARRLQEELRRRWRIEELGVILTDSHTTPLRRGVTGIALAHWGFRGLKDLVGEPDLFGRKMQMTTVNVADALATAATLMMGEANECRPLAVLQYAEAAFTDWTDSSEVRMPLKDDLYYPFFERSLGRADRGE